MTIEKGQSWGRPFDQTQLGSAAELVHAGDDAELAELAFEAHRAKEPLAAVVRNGDLLATLGVTSPRPPADGHVYPIDLCLATLSPSSAALPFVAHLTARASPLPGLLLGHGPPVTVAVMNAAWFGDLRLGPKAHPNDGLIDVIDGRVPFQQRREANRRARSGSHLPHPASRVTRAAHWERQFAKPVSIWLDGVKRGRASSVSVEVVPDAFTVVA